MSKPAARLGDMTMHGGTITVGFPQVLIGGMPAARIGDMHVCPLVNPGTPPPPHVGGPVIMGSPTVLIGNMPAARMGDMLTCAGPPDTVAMGCFTVLMGEAGSGSAGAGSAGGAGTAGANASAASAGFDNRESVTEEEHWIEFKFVDGAGLPVSGFPYRFKGPDGARSEGVLRLDGTVRRDALARDGDCEVVLMSVSEAKWSAQNRRTDEVVEMKASSGGFENGEAALFQIYRRDIRGPDVLVAEIAAEVRGGKVTSEWKAPSPEDADVLVPPEGQLRSADEPVGYSGPDYYFEAVVGPCRTRSGVLRSVDFIEVTVVDEDGQPLSNEAYVLFLADGQVRKGTLDGSGRLREDDVPPGLNKLRLPHLPDFEADV